VDNMFNVFADFSSIHCWLNLGKQEHVC